MSKKITSKDVMFGCTGTIGEPYPYEKISNQIQNLVSKIKYTQNKFIWMKAALGIMTTDTKPKLAMEECKIAGTTVKIYGLAKGWDQQQLAYHLAMMLVTLCLMGMAYLKFVLPDTIIVKHGMNKFVPEHQKDWREYKW